jgi:hypothetical protein
MSIIRTILDDIEALFQRIRDEVSPHQTSSDAADHISRAASALRCHPDASPQSDSGDESKGAADSRKLNGENRSLSGELTDDAGDSEATAKVSDAKFSEDQG